MTVEVGPEAVTVCTDPDIVTICVVPDAVTTRVTGTVTVCGLAVMTMGDAVTV